MTQNNTLSILIVALLVLVSGVGATGVALADDTTEEESDDSYIITATLDDEGEASSIDVSVDGVDQSHDLVADGEFSTTLGTGETVAFEHDDGTTADYEVGTGGDELAVSDATVSIDEELADTGGSGSASDDDDGLLDLVLERALVELLLAFIFAVLLGRGLGGKR